MKEIIAIIRMNKVNETKKALADIGICGLHVIKAMGRGKVPVDFSILNDPGIREEYGSIVEEGILLGGRLIPKRLFTILAHEDQIHDIVQTIIQVNSQGRSGDGKIFICPLLDVVRIRTGERGETAI